MRITILLKKKITRGAPQTSIQLGPAISKAGPAKTLQIFTFKLNH